MDTSGTQFYPTLFVLATDVIDMLGHLVWERIIQKAKYGGDGKVIHSLPGLYLTFSYSIISHLLIPLPNANLFFSFLHNMSLGFNNS